MRLLTLPIDLAGAVLSHALSANQGDAGNSDESLNNPAIVRLIKWSGEITTLTWDDGADAAYWAEDMPDPVKRLCRNIEVRDAATDEGILLWRDGRWASDILDPRPLNER